MRVNCEDASLLLPRRRKVVVVVLGGVGGGRLKWNMHHKHFTTLIVALHF